MKIKSCHTICIANQKGGVGKSTSSALLADGLVLEGYKVLLIDLDSQGNASLNVGADPNKPTIYDALMKRLNAQEAVQLRTHEHAHDVGSRVERASIIPSGSKLANIDLELMSTGKEYRLKELLIPLRSMFDYIVLDTPPALGVVTINAMTAANSLIIPAHADVFSLQGIGQLKETIDAVHEYTNKELIVAGIILTRHNARTVLGRDMTEVARETAKRIGTFLYKTVIRESVVIREAQAKQQSVYDYAPRSNSAYDYREFVNEFLNKVGCSHEKEI